jgi:hypothetical protein
MFENPMFQFLLDRFLQIPQEQKLSMVEGLATILNVRPGFWDSGAEPPIGPLCVVSIDPGVQGAPEEHSLAHFEAGAWKRLPSNEPIAHAVKRWAVIPTT